MTIDTTPTRRGVPGEPAIRVFIAEDHRITLWGLQRLIDAAHPRMCVVGTATTHQELITHAAVAEADVLLLDLDLAGENSTDSLRDLLRRCPGHVLVLTGTDDADQHLAAVAQGARGVVHKSEGADTLLKAIEIVNQGDFWLEPDLLGDVLNRFSGVKPQPAHDDVHASQIASLTPREREIVAVMVHNASAKQFAVAAELNLSEHTLRNHLTAIYSKLGVHGRLALHVYATEHGLATPSSRCAQS